MRRYNSLADEIYHQDTLYGILEPKITENNILKPMLVTEIKNGTAHIECEPYDSAYTPEKAERVLNRRKKAIFRALEVNCLSVTFYDEWTAKYGCLIN